MFGDCATRTALIYRCAMNHPWGISLWSSLKCNKYQSMTLYLLARATCEVIRGPVALIVFFKVGDQNPSRKVHPVSESN